VLWYFPTAPVGKDTDASNYWVYWYNPKADVIWGRCPNPHKHPDFKDMSKQAGGKDLWQVIPEDKKKKGRSVARVADNFGPTFAAEVKKEPKARPGTDPMDCVDFKDPIFQ
jgi:hypothetical protein